MVSLNNKLMKIENSNSIILLTENSRIPIQMKSSVAGFGLEIITKYLNLNSLSIMRKVMKSSKNTAFLRTELLRMIKETGFPFFIALDFKIDTGLGAEIDPDSLKILRTFLISYIILSRGRGFEELRGNFCILYTGSQASLASKIEEDPHTILGILGAKDKIINSFIDELKNDKNKFNRLFYIRTINIDLPQNDVNIMISNFVNGIKARETIFSKRSESPQFDSSTEAAKIIYIFDDDKTYIDGQIFTEQSQEYFMLEKNQIHVIGSWTNKTQLAVSQKIAAAVLKGMNGEKKFSADDQITIRLDENCRVDASTAASIAQLTAKELEKFPKTIILLSNENLTSLQNATGFNMIRKIVQRI